MHIDLPFPELREEFRRRHYAVIEDAIGAEVCARWRAEALRIAEQHSRRVEREVDGHRLRYRVVTGDTIRDQWPEMFAFYTAAESREWVRRITGAEAIFASPSLQSAININVLAEPGEVYRWHFDVVPYTALLYLTTSTPEDGGALEFYCALGAGENGPDLQNGEQIAVLPRAGMIVLMDGTRCYHRVAPILRPHQRVSIPMVFPATAGHPRPDPLDDYLYSESLPRS